MSGADDLLRDIAALALLEHLNERYLLAKNKYSDPYGIMNIDFGEFPRFVGLFQHLKNFK